LSLPFPIDSRFLSFLRFIDGDLASMARARGCRCGGALHSADYPRKPRGGPSDIEEEDRRRLSFCCDREGCRSRVTPPSVRFLGRKVFLGAVVVLSIAMRQGPSPTSIRKLHELFGVSRRTLSRWRGFWREAFSETRFWKGVRGLFMPPVARESLPLSLLQRFGAVASERTVGALLRFLAPVTTFSCEAVEPSQAP
jgi:hypothetical protein